MPGFGLSDPYPLKSCGRTNWRTLAEFPADVLAVLKKEKVTQCHLMGTSAGCVHVAALANALPDGMVQNVLLNTQGHATLVDLGSAESFTTGPSKPV